MQWIPIPPSTPQSDVGPVQGPSLQWVIAKKKVYGQLLSDLCNYVASTVSANNAITPLWQSAAGIVHEYWPDATATQFEKLAKLTYHTTTAPFGFGPAAVPVLNLINPLASSTVPANTSGTRYVFTSADFPSTYGGIGVGVDFDLDIGAALCQSQNSSFKTMEYSLGLAIQIPYTLASSPQTVRYSILPYTLASEKDCLTSPVAGTGEHTDDYVGTSYRKTFGRKYFNINFRTLLTALTTQEGSVATLHPELICTAPGVPSTTYSYCAIYPLTACQSAGSVLACPTAANVKYGIGGAGQAVPAFVDVGESNDYPQYSTFSFGVSPYKLGGFSNSANVGEGNAGNSTDMPAVVDANYVHDPSGTSPIFGSKLNLAEFSPFFCIP